MLSSEHQEQSSRLSHSLKKVEALLKKGFSWIQGSSSCVKKVIWCPISGTSCDIDQIDPFLPSLSKIAGVLRAFVQAPE